MASAAYIEELKGRAVLSCMKCETRDAHSLGRMLVFSKNGGKYLRAGVREKVQAVVNAVFDSDADGLAAAKGLIAEIKQVQPQPEQGLPVYRDDEAIRGLTDEIARNVTRFTKHLQKASKLAEATAEIVRPTNVVDGATSALEERDMLAAPRHPRIPPAPLVRRNRS